MKEEEEYEEWQLQLAKAAQAAQQLLAERSGPSDASSSSRPTRRGRRRIFIDKVGDVPVLFSDEFQQSIVFSLFIFDMWTFLLCCRDRYPHLGRYEPEGLIRVLHCCSHARCVQRHGPGYGVQKTAVSPQLQPIFKGLNFPVVPQRLIPMIKLFSRPS